MQNKVMPNIKMYRRHMNIFWWANRWIHVKFILRELTSICVAFYSILLLFFVRSVLSGPEDYDMFVSALRSPVLIIIHLLLLVGLIFHSISWFNLAPQAMVLKMGRNKVPALAIALVNYLGWVLISVVVVWLVIAG